MRLVPIQPKGFAEQMRRLPEAVKRGQREAAEAVKAEFDLTTATWEHRVTFTIAEQGDALVVGTDDEIYGYVDKGTKPHVIVPRRGRALRFAAGGRPKTTPGRITSGAGAKGGVVVIRPRVDHPGTKARDFQGQIYKRWRRGVQPYIRRAIEEALR